MDTRLRKSSICFADSMSYAVLINSKSNFVYLKMRVTVRKDFKSITFRRENYDEKFEEWLDLAKEMLNLKRRKPQWAKKKFEFDDIIEQLRVSEEIHYRYTV